VHAFDLKAWLYSNVTAALLRTTFGARFHLIEGDSTLTVPAWAARHPHACDLTFVDGDHTLQGAMIDLLNANLAVRDGALAVADDINSLPGVALEALRALSQLDILESYGPFDAPHMFNPCMRGPSFRSPVCSAWGFAVFRYRRTPPRLTALTEVLAAPKGKRGFAAAQKAKAQADAQARAQLTATGAAPDGPATSMTRR